MILMLLDAFTKIVFVSLKIRGWWLAY